jgi:hypothetical protein
VPAPYSTFSAAKDIDGDHRLDVIEAKANPTSVLTIWHNEGNLIFTANHSFALTNASAVLAEDYNGDGLADLAIASVSSAGVTPLNLVSLYINQSR